MTFKSNLVNMVSGKVIEGVFALHKPPGISSAQALRDLQKHFNPSKLFKPWLQDEQNKRGCENSNQRNRRKMKIVQVKIGHGGTLDPMATGVLIAGVGKGTKVLTSFLQCTKAYETVVLFGAATDTYDVTGKVLKRGPTEHITKELIEEQLGAFRGKIMQRPPIYSALKMDGKPLYEYARQGLPIPRKIEKRPVEVVEIELVEFMASGTHSYALPTEEASAAEKEIGDAFQAASMEEITGKEQPIQTKTTKEPAESKKRKVDESEDDLVTERPTSKKANVDSTDAPMMSGGLQNTPKPESPPAARIRMTVTSGFYVRALAFDLGQAIGSQGAMAELVRTRQGKFELGKNVLEYSELAKGEDVWGPQVEAMLEEWTKNYNPFAPESAYLGETSKKTESAATQGDSASGPQVHTVEKIVSVEKDAKVEDAAKEDQHAREPENDTIDSDAEAREAQAI